MSERLTYSAYRYVKRNRRKKKRQLTRSAFKILFDKTSLVYLSFFGLLFLSWFNNQLANYQLIFVQIEHYIWSYYFGLICFGLLRPLSSAFTRPGVLFSSSDLFLSMLPLDKSKLWLYHVIDKIKQTTILYFIIGIIVKMITLFSGRLIVSVALGFWVIEMLMIIPQWLLFQKQWYIKLLFSQGTMLIVLLTNLVIAWADGRLFLFIVSLVILILVNKWGYHQLFKLSDWSPVIEANDRLLRKNLLVSLASNVKIEPPKHRGFYHHVVRNKQLTKPFKENKKHQSYHRIIFMTFIEQKEQVIKAAFGLIGLTLLLSIQAEITYRWAIIIVLSLYVQIGTSFFPTIFEDKLIFVLPWNIKRWRRAFILWLTIGLVPVFIILMVPSLLWFDLNGVLLLNLISHLLMGHRLLLDQMDDRIKQLTGASHRFPYLYLMTFFIIFFSVIYSIESLVVGILVIIYALIRYTYDYIVNWERTK